MTNPIIVAATVFGAYLVLWSAVGLTEDLLTRRGRLNRLRDIAGRVEHDTGIRIIVDYGRRRFPTTMYTATILSGQADGVACGPVDGLNMQGWLHGIDTGWKLAQLEMETP